ncbi:MAG TPA: hypothetical protein VFV45_05870, partial [Rubrobacteraceae bacterium]|nr:hypothetical protein [Rubrobacteraceae bacterium]
DLLDDLVEFLLKGLSWHTPTNPLAEAACDVVFCLSALGVREHLLRIVFHIVLRYARYSRSPTPYHLIGDALERFAERTSYRGSGS